jgi:DNA-binding NtrC family response regulator
MRNQKRKLRQITGRIDIVLVDSDPRFQDRFERVASALGLVVKTAVDSKSFFNLLRSHQVKLVVLTENMSEQPGLSLEEFFSDLPMVYVGSQRFDDYCPQELKKKITRYVARSFGPHSAVLAAREVLQSGGHNSLEIPSDERKQVA